MPFCTASSTTYWMAGLSTRASISLGWALAAGRNLVPSPAAGMTAFLTGWDTVGCSTTDGWSDTAGGPVHWHSTGESANGLIWQEGPERMPTYEYACKTCGEHLEVVQSFKDEPLTECPNCGGPLRKVFGNIGIAFKGSGFYKTDSRAASKAGAGTWLEVGRGGTGLGRRVVRPRPRVEPVAAPKSDSSSAPPPPPSSPSASPSSAAAS